jgi:hypothetical protein
MEVIIEHLAVAAPVAAKVEDDVFVGLPRGDDGLGDLLMSIRRIGVKIEHLRLERRDNKNKGSDENKRRFSNESKHGTLLLLVMLWQSISILTKPG